MTSLEKVFDAKKRSANFSEEDRTLLMSLIKKPRYFNIIESKKTNANTNQEKWTAWTLLSKEFNACSKYQRDPKSLKSKYENIKKTSKKQYADRKLYIRKTGGGPSQVPNTKIDEELLGLLGPQITGNQDQFGGDCDSSKSDEDCLNNTGTNGQSSNPYLVGTSLDSSRFEIELEEDKCENSVDYDYLVQGSTNTEDPPETTFNASKLRQAKSAALKPAKEKGQGLLQKLETWAVKKEELADMQKKAFWEEHLLQLKHKQEIHELQIRQMEKLHDLEVRIRTEKWQLEMNALYKK